MIFDTILDMILDLILDLILDMIIYIYYNIIYIYAHTWIFLGAKIDVFSANPFFRRKMSLLEGNKNTYSCFFCDFVFPESVARVPVSLWESGG